MRKLTKGEIPYLLTSIVFAMFTNQLVYQGTKLINMNMHHWNIMLPIDHQIPLVSWTVLIYFGSYVFWTLGYTVIALQSDRHESERFFCTALIAKLFCLVFFIAFPTTLTRPEITGTTLFDALMRLLYSLDHPINLFPSLHCIASWLCWVGVRGKREIPFSLKVSALVLAILVFISVLTTRQHVVVDIFGGILVAEISALIARNDSIVALYSRISGWIMRTIFRRKGLED